MWYTLSILLSSFDWSLNLPVSILNEARQDQMEKERTRLYYCFGAFFSATARKLQVRYLPYEYITQVLNH